MIVTEQKKFEEILSMLEGAKSVFIVGCGSCSTTSNTGGEKEVAAMKAELEKRGFSIAGSSVVESPCDARLNQKIFRENKEAVESADAFLVMSCGAGVQTVAGLVGKKVFPALNSMFIAEIKRAGKFYEMCVNCGECQLDKTGGICLMTRCPKNTLNGPCGGSVKGKCEVNQDSDCAWSLIEERLKQINSVDSIKDFRPAKDWTAAMRPHKVE